ncbi:hypothetical protein NQZ68_003972 [Dissostichus eleginoides]|nr:hypothetical protein NQZ68_003972 [Dissostichus eleginoides]
MSEVEEQQKAAHHDSVPPPMVVCEEEWTECLWVRSRVESGVTRCDVVAVGGGLCSRAALRPPPPRE